MPALRFVAVFGLSATLFTCAQGEWELESPHEDEAALHHEGPAWGMPGDQPYLSYEISPRFRIDDIDRGTFCSADVMPTNYSIDLIWDGPDGERWIAERTATGRPLEVQSLVLHDDLVVVYAEVLEIRRLTDGLLRSELDDGGYDPRRSMLAGATHADYTIDMQRDGLDEQGWEPSCQGSSATGGVLLALCGDRLVYFSGLTLFELDPESYELLSSTPYEPTIHDQIEPDPGVFGWLEIVIETPSLRLSLVPYYYC